MPPRKIVNAESNGENTPVRRSARLASKRGSEESTPAPATPVPAKRAKAASVATPAPKPATIKKKPVEKATKKKVQPVESESEPEAAEVPAAKAAPKKPQQKELKKPIEAEVKPEPKPVVTPAAKRASTRKPPQPKVSKQETAPEPKEEPEKPIANRSSKRKPPQKEAKKETLVEVEPETEEEPQPQKPIANRSSKRKLPQKELKKASQVEVESLPEVQAEPSQPEPQIETPTTNDISEEKPQQKEPEIETQVEAKIEQPQSETQPEESTAISVSESKPQQNELLKETLVESKLEPTPQPEPQVEAKIEQSQSEFQPETPTTTTNEISAEKPQQNESEKEIQQEEPQPEPELEEEETAATNKIPKRRLEGLEPVSIPSKRLRASSTDYSGELFTLGEELVGEMGPREKVYNELKIKRNQPGRVKLSEKIRQVVTGAYHTLVITERGQLISFGCNDDAALGRITATPENGEEEDDDYEEKMCRKPLPVGGQIRGKVVKVSAGDMHSAALDEHGNVFIWGNFKDESNKIGLFVDDPVKGSDCLGTQLPKQIDLDGKKVIDIASGSHHFLMLTNDGLLYSMGEGSKGQLGRIEAADLNSVTTNRELFIKPHIVKFPEPISISRIFASQWFSFALTTNGILYAWGLNNYNQLGFVTRTPIEFDHEMSINGMANLNAELFPVRVPTLESKMSEIASVAVGQQHLTVLDTNGHVFTIGSALYGKLGHGKAFIGECGDGSCSTEFKQIDPSKFGNDRISYIECGDFSSFAITETGRLYSWGQASAHIGSEDVDLFEPTLVKSPYADEVSFYAGSSGPQFSGWIGLLKPAVSNGQNGH